MSLTTNFVLVLCVILGSVAVGPATAGAPAAHVPQARTSKASTKPTVLLNADDIRRLRGQQQAYAALIKQGTAKLGYVAKPLEVFGPEPHYSATGLNPSANNDKQLSLDAQAAYQTALAYVFTNDPRYAAATQRIIDAWAGTLKRVTTEQGRAGVNFSMPYMILAASWVRDANSWNSASFDAFLTAVVLPQSSSANPNNHGLWGVLLESSAAAYLGDVKRLSEARDRWQEILRGEVLPNGTMPQEMERSNTTNWRGGPDKGIKGIAYTHYTLLPTSMAAKIFADQGQPVWDTEGGKLLQLAFTKAASWTEHPETFPYYAANNGKLVGVRDAAYFTLLLAHYPNADAEAVLRQGDVGADGFRLLELFGQTSAAGR